MACRLLLPSHLTPALCPDDSLLLMRLPHEVLCLIPSWQAQRVKHYQVGLAGNDEGQHPVRVGTLPPYLPGPLPPSTGLLIWVSGCGEEKCETKVEETGTFTQIFKHVILMSTEKRDCGKDLLDCFEIAVTFT